MMLECIKEGFNLINRSWQLILLRTVVAVINLFIILLFIGVPAFIAVVSFGIDIAQTGDIFRGIISDPAEILSKYLWIFALLSLSLIVSVTVISIITLYTYGGIMGVLRNSALNKQYKFSLASFFNEAGSLFFPLFWLLSFGLCIAIGAVIFFGILTGIFIFIIRAYDGIQSTFSIFVVSFFALSLITLGIIGALGGLILTVYSVISLVVERKGTIDSFKSAWNLLKNQPSGFLFYIIIFLGFIVINIILMIFGGVLSIIPLVGIAINIPYHLIYYVVQVYLNLVLWGALLVYYLKVKNRTDYNSMYDI